MSKIYYDHNQEHCSRHRNEQSELFESCAIEAHEESADDESDSDGVDHADHELEESVEGLADASCIVIDEDSRMARVLCHRGWDELRRRLEHIVVASHIDCERVRLRAVAYLIGLEGETDAVVRVFGIQELCGGIVHVVGGQTMALPIGKHNASKAVIFTLVVDILTQIEVQLHFAVRFTGKFQLVVAKFPIYKY